MQPFGHNRHGPKIGAVHPFWGGELGLYLTQSRLGRPAEVYLHTNLSGILIRPAIWPQLIRVENWMCAPFWEGELVPI